MKTHFSEYKNDYSKYLFGYAVYCQQETKEEQEEIYNNGFLPYTGDLSINESTYYLARSLRVDLAKFEDTSENRRVNRKIEPLGISVKLLPKNEVVLSDEMVDFCLSYAKERFADGEMSRERLQYVWSRTYFTHTLQFNMGNKVVGYVFCCNHNQTLHYWYAFFDTQLMLEYPIGKWIMWKTISWAKENGYAYVYLGTCYRTKSLYKVRDFIGVEFFDGGGWNCDAKVLKERCKND